MRMFCTFCGDLLQPITNRCKACDLRSLQHQTSDQRVLALLDEVIANQGIVIMNLYGLERQMATVQENLQALQDTEGEEKGIITSLVPLVGTLVTTINDLHQTIDNLQKDVTLPPAQATALDLGVAASKANLADVKALLNSLAGNPPAGAATGVNVDPPDLPTGTATEVSA